MEQLGFEGMPRRLYTCTPTRLSSWLDCPRRYRMSYLDRPSPPKGPPWAHNSVGASVHNALAGWWRLPLAQRTVAAAGNLVDRGWINEGFADETQSVRQRERAIAMVEGYVAGLDPHGHNRRLRPDRPPRRQARARRGGLQDRTAPADHGRRAQLDGPGLVRAGRREGTAAGLPPGGAAPPAHRRGPGLVAHRRIAGPAPAPGRGHRRGVRRGRRADARRPALRRLRPGLPAPPRPVLCLVRLPAALPRRHRGRPAPPPLGRPPRRLNHSSVLAAG